MWKGHIRFSLVTIPVRIYNAIETADTISFNQLHKEDNGRVAYDKRCKKCNKVLKGDEIVKGFEYEPDRFVIVEQDDLDKVKLKSTKIIEIEGFVDASEVHPALYDSPYFAGPDGDVAGQAYALLRETLKNSGKVGVGRVVLRDRESVMLLTAKDNGMLLYKLRYPNEVRSIDEIPQVDGLKADEAQLKLAQTLVDSMAKSFDEITLEDRYKGAVRDIINQKIEGKEVVSVAEEEQPVVDIMAALKASIENAKAEKKPMQKAGKEAKAAEETAKGKKKKVA
jgi:DNA end-binding protein Ku